MSKTTGNELFFSFFSFFFSWSFPFSIFLDFPFSIFFDFESKKFPYLPPHEGVLTFISRGCLNLRAFSQKCFSEFYHAKVFFFYHTRVLKYQILPHKGFRILPLKGFQILPHKGFKNYHTRVLNIIPHQGFKIIPHKGSRIKNSTTQGF